MNEPERPQLRMVWPPRRIHQPPDVIPPHGYAIRTYRPGDEEEFYKVMRLAGWPGWNADTLQFSLSRILPSGWFMATQAVTGRIVASAMCIHNYTQRHPFWGDVGWLACDPEHTGKGLGYVLSAAVTARFISAGYANIGLHTEHYQLPAIKTYFKLGYIPLIDRAETHTLWEQACRELQWPFTLEHWRKQGEQEGSAPDRLQS